MKKKRKKKRNKARKNRRRRNGRVESENLAETSMNQVGQPEEGPQPKRNSLADFLWLGGSTVLGIGFLLLFGQRGLGRAGMLLLGALTSVFGLGAILCAVKIVWPNSLHTTDPHGRGVEKRYALETAKFEVLARRFAFDRGGIGYKLLGLAIWPGAVKRAIFPWLLRQQPINNLIAAGFLLVLSAVFGAAGLLAFSPGGGFENAESEGSPVGGAIVMAICAVALLYFAALMIAAAISRWFGPRAEPSQ